MTPEGAVKVLDFGLATVMQMHVSGAVPAVRNRRPAVPEGLATVVKDLLAKNPEDRPTDANTVYRALLPYVDELPPLPAVLTPAAVLTPLKGAPSTAHVDRCALRLARDEVARLLDQSRFHQASEVLAAIVQPAVETFGELDEDVLQVRRQLADALFADGHYRAAGPAFAQLAEELVHAGRADDALALTCRQQAATCEAVSGKTTTALRLLTDLLTDRTRLFGAHDPQTLEVRRQIGLLQLGAGDDRTAVVTLGELATDLRELHGDRHPEVQRVQEVLDRIAARSTDV